MKDSTVEDLDELHKQAKSARQRLEPIWLMNMAYFENYQWLAFDNNRLYRPSMPKGRMTVVDNRITPAVRKELARMTKSRPTFVVTPQSADEEDANAARLGDQIMRFLWKTLNLQPLSYKALEWARICCAGFLKAVWDPTIGESVEVLMDSQGQPIAGPSGGVIKNGSPEAGLAMHMAAQQQQEIVVKRVSQGDLRVEVRSPFQMFVDPLADTFEEAEWLIEESVKSQNWVQQHFNVEIEPDTPSNPGLIAAAMGQALQPGVTSYKGVRVREYWCKPCVNYPQGCRTVWVPHSKGKGGQILVQDSQPFDPQPYVMFSGIPVPGRLWPMSLVELLRGPQDELNKTRSQLAENRNRVGNPTVVADQAAVRDPEKFRDSTMLPGGIVWIDSSFPNAVPQYLPAPEMPEYVQAQIPLIEDSFAEISGQHEVTSAQVPPGVTAASAINLLMESDDTQLGPAIADYEYQLGRLGQKLLKLAARFYTDARTIRIGGDNGAWQIFDFRGSMLRDNTHVEVQAGSALPQSKAAKQAAMQDWLTYFVQSGQPLQGAQLAKFMDAWDLGAMGRFLEEYTNTESQVNRENAKMGQGQPLPINDYDQDDQHVEYHEEFQRGASYSQLPPQIQQIFEQHVDAHRQRLQQLVEQQQAMMAQAQGQPTPQDMQAQQAQQQQAAQQQQGQQAQQAQQQMDIKGAQAQQQQGLSQAQQDQQQRHAEEVHQQKLRQNEEAHQARLRQQAQQAQQAQRQQGANRGNR